MRKHEIMTVSARTPHLVIIKASAKKIFILQYKTVLTLCVVSASNDTLFSISPHHLLKGNITLDEDIIVKTVVQACGGFCTLKCTKTQQRSCWLKGMFYFSPGMTNVNRLSIMSLKNLGKHHYQCKNNAERAERLIGFFADREESCNSKSCGPWIK